MKVAPGIINTIKETIELLEKNNHSIVEFKFPKLNKFRDFFFEFVYQTGFLTPVHRRMEGHHTSHQMQQFYDLKLSGKNSLLKWRSSQVNDKSMKHIYSLFMKETKTI